MIEMFDHISWEAVFRFDENRDHLVKMVGL